ncbi:cytochrome b-c1 complex subunit 7 [Polychytrium aggregatum]|uniref:cytochrome b-c1 complex subunit 7 n=1 Tax=Polychytrium aggregatum TaxID=110093 RepID=UPI0022FDBCBF|nr:cytochrome b-c1 complex subunit 7 [Polychytrium aggregatum]XP_052964473.1 cytochrome b-c1 complex subunit 7 [Polychytrium aggregatum]KAI9188525.1 cytochrome b-c1 complex subunit 7 [Polychytrium aggregatum]KAI9202393.1 cytochrome b-c1 complex subunit 7 [Polychytrium aggregatum]
MNNLLQAVRQFKASKAFASLRETHANLMGYRKSGLVFDDLIPDEGPIVSEALKRLTPQEFNERTFRFRRALNISLHQTVLPVAEQTKPSEDVPYLRPIIAEVEAEVACKQTFDLLTGIPENLRSRNKST